MALDKIVDDINEVPEFLRENYVEKETDGKKQWHYQEVTPLKNSLTHAKRERDEARAKAKKVDEWEKLGKSAEEIQALLKTAEEDAAKKAKESGDHETILKQHQTKWEKDLEAAKSQADLWRNKYVSSHVNGNLLTELNKGEATAEGIELLPNILRDRVKVEVVDGEVKTRILATDGNAMAGSGADGAATFADLVKDARTRFPSLFKGTGQSGSGANGEGGKSNGGGAPTNLKRGAMTLPEKAKFISEHGEAAYFKLPMS